ncbi:hypothetical protein [Bradyrhizobium sp. BR 10289]|uniref:hypothetical protein n=1 Tax=Bradyrhizobium sp. BR 10289 TaxID=2749993 RepID=UPI001C650E62|nr:hypothetical protein [Bradyrhizobium sp. BR 10289]MBW7968331.1 hypothetical protein [Bradyrhizobium sp. BR 10289]
MTRRWACRAGIETSARLRRSMVRWLRASFAVVVLQLLIGSLVSEAWADAPSKPALTVILERNEILAGQTMSFSLWIENATDAKMTKARLILYGPASLKIGKFGKNDACTPEDAIDLGDIESGSTRVWNGLCLQAGSSIEERDENLGFGVSYSLEKDKKITSGAIVSEKKLSLGLFGTESVGGVSLRLASYIIPGVFFLMILRLCAPQWNMELGATESATLSILISVLLFLLAAFGLPSLHLRFAGIGSTVNALAFLVQCGFAAVLALIVAAVLHGISWIQDNRRNARIVQGADSESTIILKALRAADGKFEPVMMAADNKQFFGSLVVPANNGGSFLLGWFQLKVPDDKRRSQAEEWVRRNEFVQLLENAARWGIAPTMMDPIKVPDAGGDLQPTSEMRMYFDGKAVRSTAGRAELKGRTPLTVKR